MNRRKFLVTTATAAAAVGCRTTRGEGIKIIDTHTHFYDPSRPQGVPWPPKNDSVLYRTVLPAELKSIVEPLGVKGTVVVEASPVVEDNAWVLEIAKERTVHSRIGWASETGSAKLCSRSRPFRRP
jgi:predicted TIM-barrel fold metal-dependent hydrolase